MAVKGRGQLVNKTELAAILGITTPTVDSWVRDGCPIEKKGSHGVPAVFNTAAVMKWLQLRAREEATGETVADERELKRRKLLAETEKAELELAIAKGDVAPIREFERVSAAQDAAVRTNMRNVPRRAVLQLLGCTDEAEFITKLMAEIDLALVTAADTELEPDEDAEESADG